MKILWLANVPSPYRVDFFNELGKKCDLTVVFEKKTSDERDKSWLNYKFLTFKGIFLNGKSINTDTAFCPSIIRYLKKSYDEIIVTNVSSPTGMIAIQYMKFNHIKYWIEGDGGFPKNGKGIKEKIKRHFITGAYGYFSTGKSHDDYYLFYGANKGSIYKYPFTSLSNEDIKYAYNMIQLDKEKIKKQLKIIEDKVVLSVGRFSYDRGYGKGYDILMKSAENTPKGIGFYIVGDEPTEEFIKWKQSKKLDNVHFVGFKNKKDLSYYYSAADVFVLMTRGDVWGLVINEAMSYGLPIISTAKCGAGLELIQSGVNGYIMDSYDFRRLGKLVIELCSNDDIRKRMKDNNLEIAKEYTVEHMAEKHIDIFRKEKE
ncbi:hypothetical protein RASY3_02445 [Ruminococcus albus SY3]|uniref:Glycosyl transferase family 1 domain-containing protein n=1 Tax=Ruminococcus albus SY3 TaxID=1341156 RepID=A0A011VSG2_RUMAL|nr:glycosyltransferase family 4 protein [Ruminococcus albus]EXM38186.1 hypothetical protein RASY3_18105 [Ruminococcus albus SY3]EXM40673.1 hypothetical protein RASY3_02445 [Ruminococcus albus SY3]